VAVWRLEAAETVAAVDTEGLIRALRAGAYGTVPREAALELLLEHGHWINRASLREHVKGSWGYSGDAWVFLARINWRAAAEAGMRSSTSEDAMLRIAASIGDRDYGVSLSEATSSLGSASRSIVLRAVERLLAR
jgi:hypothetical protein